MGTTTKRAYPYPATTDANNAPYRLQLLAEAVDVDVDAILNPPTLRVHRAGAAVSPGAAGAWWQVFYDTPSGSRGGANAPTLASGVVTVTQAGLYDVRAAVTVQLGSDFAIRITNVTVAGSPVVICQTPVGAGASLTTGCADLVTLTAGSKLQVEIYGATAKTYVTEAVDRPCHFTVSRRCA